jgi:hypothetical protein
MAAGAFMQSKQGSVIAIYAPPISLPHQPLGLPQQACLPAGDQFVELESSSLMRRFLNWTFIGGPGCIWRAMTPSLAAVPAC